MDNAGELLFQELTEAKWRSDSKRTSMRIILIAAVLLTFVGVTAVASPSVFMQDQLDAAFEGATVVDLATCKVNSVVTLRDTVKIPAPSEKVLVKAFKRECMPEVLRQVFAKPEMMGVTVNSRYVAIIDTDLEKEYQDVLAHELVHAYISLASPKPLPFWFQEGSAVRFSTDKVWKFYGQPSKDELGVMVGRKVELTDTYKQKLHSFHYLIDKVGKKRFYAWYRETVESGNVNARPLLGLKPIDEVRRRSQRDIPLWEIVVAGGIVLVVVAVGICVARQESEYL